MCINGVNNAIYRVKYSFIDKTERVQERINELSKKREKSERKEEERNNGYRETKLDKDRDTK
jgi:hypothetical protein